MKKNFWIGSLLLFFALLSAQNQEPQKFRLIHADRLYMSNLPEGQILDLSGNVTSFMAIRSLKAAAL